MAAASEYIDLIIGGHTHTFLDQPAIRRNRKDKQVLINQVGCYGLNLGRIDFYFDELKNTEARGLTIKV
jgi:5'-nucleotidase